MTKASKTSGLRKVHSRRSRLFLAPSLGLAMLAGACGGGAGAGSEDDEPFSIGITADISGPAAATYGPVADGFRIYMEARNAEGGIDGTPVDLTVRDNESDPARLTADVRRFLGDGVVLTLNGSPSSTLAAYGGSMEEMPTMYGNACYPPSTPPEPAQNFFCIGADPITDMKAHVEAVQVGYEDLGIPEEEWNVAFALQDIPGCQEVVDMGQAMFEDLGIEVTGREAVPPDVHGMEGVARSMVNQGANAVVHYCLTAQSVNLGEALDRLAFDGVYASAGIVPGVKPAVASLEYPNFYAVDWFSLPSEDLEVWQDIEAAADDYDASYEPIDLAWGWAMGMVAEEALAECGSPCEREELNDVMNSLSVDSDKYLELMLSPLEWSSDNHVSPQKAFQVTVFDPDTGELSQLLEEPLILDVDDWPAS